MTGGLHRWKLICYASYTVDDPEGFRDILVFHGRDLGDFDFLFTAAKQRGQYPQAFSTLVSYFTTVG